MLDHIIQEIAEGPTEPGQICPDPKLLNGAMQVLMHGQAKPEQVAALLMGLRVRGILPIHLQTCVEVMLDHARNFPSTADMPLLVDTAGTGGSRRTTINISTATALILAAAGIPVAKHGNFGVSSKSGSANVMQVFGYKLDCLPEWSEKMLRQHNFTFLFAPFYHQATGKVAPVRREIKIRTIFNLAGPLSNPAMPTHQIVGVTERNLLGLMAETMRDLGRTRAIVAHGRNGMDEVSLVQVTEAMFVREDGEIEKLVIEPRDFGTKMIEMADLMADSPEDSAVKVRRILEGEKGPASDQVNANTAMVLWMTDKAPDLKGAFEMAREAQESGKGAELLDKVVAMSNATPSARVGAHEADGNF